MSSTNEELCERVLPLPYRESTEFSLDNINWSRQMQVKTDRELLAVAITSGLLIPAEKMLTVEEIEPFLRLYMSKTKLDDWPDRFDDITKQIAKLIHQSSRQKAGV